MTIRMLPAMLAGMALAATCNLSFAGDDETPMDLAYEADARDSTPTVYKDTCPIHVVATEDARPNKLTIGAKMGGPLLAGDAGHWVTDGLGHLKEYGYTVDRVDAGTVPANGLLVQTSVTRAYTWQIGLKIFGMVAIKAKFTGPNGVVQEKFYRAHGDKTNMMGASSEYVTTLNYGLNNLVRAMADDLGPLCKGQAVDKYTYAGPDTALKTASK